MRSDETMFYIILSTAQEDERIRAVLLNGSRANPNAPRDRFQDFDIVYIVTNVTSFVDDTGWIARFGELMILQTPDTMLNSPPTNGRFTYLMQFTDGTRIDLTLYPLTKLHELPLDSQTILLLDKDTLFAPFPPPSDRDYLPEPPSAKAFADCCNEFWWVTPYVAKGLKREEILYAKHMLDGTLREQLMHMLIWYMGIATNFAVNPGKYGKYLKRYLEPELWRLLEQTYANASYEQTWEALFNIGILFRRIAKRIAAYYDFTYPQGDDERVSTYIRDIHQRGSV